MQLGHRNYFPVLAASASLSFLRCLQVVVRNELFKDRGAALLSAVKRLPALETLDISYDTNVDFDEGEISDINGLPCCKELAQLHSRSLTRLRVCMLDGPTRNNMLRLSGLPELRSLELVGHEGIDRDPPEAPALNIRIDAASFKEVPQLQSLQITFGKDLILLDSSLVQLTALTSLALTGCGLQSVPADLSSLCATLRELELSRNEPLQLDDAAVASIVQCSRLTVLGLHKPDVQVIVRSNVGETLWQTIDEYVEESYYPAQWNADSVRHLVQLPAAFRARHGHDLSVVM